MAKKLTDAEIKGYIKADYCQKINNKNKNSKNSKMMKLITSLCIATYAAAVHLAQHDEHLHAQTKSPAGGNHNPIESAISDGLYEILDEFDDDNSWSLDRMEATDFYLKLNPNLSAD